MVGKTFGHYKVLAPLGAGGMGEVYRARDTKLDRDVAIKVLPADFAADQDRLARFEREARMLASLNHDNIATIFGLEDEGEQRVIAMELVEGETLAARLSRGSTGIDDGLDIVCQVAKALEAAHGSGVIHRDLKPANVMITPDGRVKLLDFGVAKTVEHLGSVETVQATNLTATGTMVGTAPYMSPEQVRGKPLDKRADIWALGCLLFETLTGERAFSRETVGDTLSAVLEHEPDWDALPDDVPAGANDALRRCLRKDADERTHDVADVRIVLSEALKWRMLQSEGPGGAVDHGAASTSGAATPAAETAAPAAGSGSRALSAALVVVAVAAVAIAWMMLWGGGAGNDAPGLRVTTHGIAVSSARESSSAISPDGEWIVFAMAPEGPPPEGVTLGAPPPTDLFLRTIDGQNRINLTNTPLASESSPAYSPDGSQLAFVRTEADGSSVYVMGTTGENPRFLARRVANLAWSADGTKLYVTERAFEDPRLIEGVDGFEIRAIDVAGGEEAVIFDHPNWIAIQPAGSPNGERVAFWGISPDGGQRDIWTIPAAGGDPVPVTSDRAVDWSPLWSPDGRYLYFSSDRGGSMNIWRVAIVETTGEVLGEPEPLTSGGLGDQGMLSISADGSRLAYTDLLVRSHAVLAGFDAETLTVGSDGEQVSGPVRVMNLWPSPDGRLLAYVSLAPQHDLWVVEVDGGNERRLTDDVDKEWRPIWLNDDATLVFYSDKGGGYDLWRIRSDGSERAKIAATEADEIWLVASPEGRTAAVAHRGIDHRVLLEIGDDPSSPVATALPPVSETEGSFMLSDWSPDGEWIAGDLRGILLYNLEAGEYRRLTDRGERPRFTPDGSRIIYRVPLGSRVYEWWIVDTETLVQRQINTPSRTIDELWLLPDGAHVVYEVWPEPESDVWVLEIEEAGRGRFPGSR